MWEERGRVLSCLPFTRNRCIHMKAGVSVVLIFNLQNHYLLRCSLLILLLSYVSRDVLYTVSIVLCSLRSTQVCVSFTPINQKLRYLKAQKAPFGLWKLHGNSGWVSEIKAKYYDSIYLEKIAVHQETNFWSGLWGYIDKYRKKKIKNVKLPRTGRRPAFKRFLDALMQLTVTDINSTLFIFWHNDELA